MIVRVVEYQVGVDILGSPIYHQHIFFEQEKSTVKRTKKLVNGVIQNQVKQY